MMGSAAGAATSLLSTQSFHLKFTYWLTCARGRTNFSLLGNTDRLQHLALLPH